MKRPLYCECGGLIKLKSRKKKFHPRGKYDYKSYLYFMQKSKIISKYTCSKCGKEYK